MHHQLFGQVPRSVRVHGGSRAAFYLVHMLPILNAGQMRSLDAHTIATEPILSIDLMERAAGRCAQWITDSLRNGAFGPSQEISFLVLAGMGNNGGDGLVVARLLHGSGVPVRVVRIEYRAETTPDNGANWERLLELGVPCISGRELSDDAIGESDVVIDALFGTGLSAPVPNAVASAISSVRASGRPVVAIDMPSGLFSEDNSSNDPDRIIRAHWTLTFQVPKLAMLLPENAPYVGAWELIPIGADMDHCRSLATSYWMTQENDVVGMLRPRPRFGHKGTFGHALLVAGSKGRYGAAVLATRAALRSGVGLVTAHVPAGALVILQTACPEAMCTLAEHMDRVDSLPELGSFSGIGLGPGLGSDGDTALVLKRIIQDASGPLVLDADALNILSENPTWITFLPATSILTPHPKEFDRLEGSTALNGYHRLERARELARKWGVIIVLKGAYTAVCVPGGQVYFNSTGNPGMAKGGSGDALTGVLTGLLAQGYPPMEAALLGVHVHGLAGDLAALHVGMDGMTAGDLIDALPKAWQHLRNAGYEGSI